MSLLDFARGPALYWSLIIMVAGIMLRLVGALFLRHSKPLSKPRSERTIRAGLRTMITRNWLPATLGNRVMLQQVTGYVLHIGLFIVILLYVPHIEFIRGLTGLDWPGLPNNIIHIASAVTLAVMLYLLIRRLTNPVLRTISDADDYVSWLVTFLPLLTGILAYGHLLLRYETMLALHLLSVELLIVWFPFGKLTHALLVFPGRFINGAAFERRGVRS